MSKFGYLTKLKSHYKVELVEEIGWKNDVALSSIGQMEWILFKFMLLDQR